MSKVLDFQSSSQFRRSQRIRELNIKKGQRTFSEAPLAQLSVAEAKRVAAILNVDWETVRMAAAFKGREEIQAEIDRTLAAKARAEEAKSLVKSHQMMHRFDRVCD